MIYIVISFDTDLHLIKYNFELFLKIFIIVDNARILQKKFMNETQMILEFWTFGIFGHFEFSCTIYMHQSRLPIVDLRDLRPNQTKIKFKLELKLPFHKQ